ncbi:MAG: hypothetical protein CMK07_08935 [Ponticaulis sp.]|nr:hypothetical protein [Ponticaulis sp.]
MLRVLFLCLVSLLLCVSASGAGGSDTPPMNAPNIYQQTTTALNNAPDFSSFEGEITLIVLFQPHCSWCPIQMKEAAELQQERAPWLNIVAVSRGGTIPELLEELQRYDVQFPAYQGSRSMNAALQEPPGTPCVYLIGPDGYLGQYTCGRKTVDELVLFLMGKL